MENTKISVWAIVGLLLGISALLLSAIPIINNFAFVLGILGLIFGIIGLIQINKGKRGGMGATVSAMILSALAIVIVLVSQQMYGAAVDDAAKKAEVESGKMTGEKTDDLLKTDVDVVIGRFEVTEGEYGITTTKLPITVTNKHNKKKSYTIQVEAVDTSGTRIADDYVYANDLGAGQTQNFDVFKYIESEKLEAAKAAEFKVVEVSQI